MRNYIFLYAKYYITTVKSRIFNFKWFIILIYLQDRYTFRTTLYVYIIVNKFRKSELRKYITLKMRYEKYLFDSRIIKSREVILSESFPIPFTSTVGALVEMSNVSSIMMIESSVSVRCPLTGL